MCSPVLEGTQLLSVAVNETRPSGSGLRSYKSASIASNLGSGQWYADATLAKKVKANESRPRLFMFRWEEGRGNENEKNMHRLPASALAILYNLGESTENSGCASRSIPCVLAVSTRWHNVLMLLLMYEMFASSSVAASQGRARAE